MKKTRLFLTIMGLLLAAPVALAVTSPYNWGFEKQPVKNTSTHTYIVGTGWGYYYDDPTGERNTFPNYSTSINTMGTNKSNAILLYTTTGCTDLIVSPAVKGDVSLKVRKQASSSKSSSISFYTLTKAADGTYTIVGQLTDVTVPTLTTTLQQVSIGTFTEDTYIGILGHQVYIDDFSAGSADVDLVPAADITTVASNNGNYVDADADGNFTASFKVSLKNTGDVNLAANEDTILVTDRATGKQVLAQPVTTALNMSKTATVNIAIPLTLAEYPAGNTYYFNFQETLTGDSYNTLSKGVTPVEYKPQMTLRFTPTSDTLTTGDQVNFKYSKADVTKTLTLYNDGGAPLEISEIALSDGFTCSVAAPYTVAAHKSASVVITESAATAGEKTGTMTLKTNDYDLVLNLKGRIVEQDAFFYNVDDDGWQVPGYFVNDGNWSTLSNSLSLKFYEENSYSLQAAKDKTGKFITPLLGFKAGDKMEFDARKFDASSALKVYYSADRKHWTLAKDITNDLMSDEVTNGSYYAFTHFALDNIPAGNWYVAFEAGHSVIDNLIGPARATLTHDLYVSSQTLPTAGKVNSELEVSASVVNTLDQEEAASAYTVTLHIGNDAFAQSSATIDAYSTAYFNLTATPHSAGTYPLWVSYDFADGYSLATDTVDVVISAEDGQREVTAGEGNFADLYVPVYTGTFASQSETIYLASELNLREGAKITGITYRGADGTGSYGAAYTPVTTKLTIYIQNTTDSTNTSQVGSATSSVSSSDEAIYSSDYTIGSCGKLSSYDSKISGYTLQQAGDKIVVTFDKPFTYTGGNLRVIVNSVIPSGSSVFTNYFETDRTVTDRCVYRTSYTEANLASASFAASKLPVAHFAVSSEASTVSGKVTAQSGGAAIEGATVTLKSGDVLYTATTAADGTYSAAIYQDARDYEVTAEAQGYYPAKATMTVSGAVTSDFALQQATGLFVSSAVIPATGSVNALYQATAVGKNYTTATISNYTAKLYLGGEVVAEAQAVPVEAGAQATYTFSFTPHAAVTQAPAYVELALSDSNKQASDTVLVTISDENISYTDQWGDSVNINGNGAPAYWGYKHSQSQFYYTPEQVSVPAGAKVTRIYFKGYCNGTTSYDATVNVWLKNSADVPTITSTIDTTTATKVFGGTVHIEKKGTYTEPVVVLDLPLTEEFTYEGGNIIVLVKSAAESTNPTFFVGTGTSTQARYRANANESTMLTRSWSTTNLPVAYIDYVNYVEVSGTVVEASDPTVPVAGATVTYVNGDVQYQAVTDANGAYSFKIGKLDLDYSVTASCTAYYDTTVTVAAADLATPLTLALTRIPDTGITDVSADAPTAPEGVFTIDGRQLRTRNSVDGLEPGLYIVGGKKVMIKR